VKWESRGGCKTDDSLKSFLFTLKNPQNIPARRFALKIEKKYCAIDCDSKCGPSFGCAIVVRDNCNVNTNSFVYFDNINNGYIDDTGGNEKIFFTSSQNIQVMEIEVFEIRLNSSSYKSCSLAFSESLK
jgi:hypothetical protein